MAGSVNKVLLIGNLGRDPEIRFTQSGDKVATMSVATSESWKDKTTGERRERTEWHRVVIFNTHLAEVAEKYLRKDGQEKYTTEVVLQRFRGELQMLDKRGDGPPPAAGSPSPKTSHGDTLPPSDIDDEIPF